jgi:hypothetical protein
MSLETSSVTEVADNPEANKVSTLAIRRNNITRKRRCHLRSGASLRAVGGVQFDAQRIELLRRLSVINF